MKSRFVHRIIGGGFNHGASACVGARAAEHAVMLVAGDRCSQLPPANQSLQYAADGRRTPFPWLLRRHSKVAAELGVMRHEMGTVTLNIRYDMPDSDWEKLTKVYEAMPGWRGFVDDGCPVWCPDGVGNGDISASVEPSGLLFEASVSETTWELWLADFTQRATTALGFEVRDAEA